MSAPLTTAKTREGTAQMDTQPPTLKREKVTGTALEQRFDRWAEARREARTPERRARSARRGVLIALVVALVGIAVFSGLSTRAHEQQMSNGNAEVEGLRAALTSTGETAAVTVVDPSQVADLSARAGESATIVAEKQQQYAALMFAENTAPSTDNGAPSSETLATIEHRRSLAEHWAPDSLIVDEPLAYQFTTVPYFKRDQIDPRFPWFVKYEGTLAADPASYGWQVASVMPSLGAPDTAKVVWISANDDGQMLAWASARYDDASRTFSDLDLMVTTTGSAYQSETDAAKAARLPELIQE